MERIVLKTRSHARAMDPGRLKAVQCFGDVTCAEDNI